MVFLEENYYPPWIEKLLPSRYKTVEKELMDDQSSQHLLQETEAFLDELINNARNNEVPDNRKWKKKLKGYTVTVRVSKRFIAVQGIDTSKASTHIGSHLKKKFFIECYRKFIHSKNGTGKCRKSIIMFNDRGRIFKRNIKRSPYFQGIFYKITLLDDTLIDNLTDRKSSIHSLSTVNSNEPLKKELDRLYFHHYHNLSLEASIQGRVERMMSITKQLLPDFDLFDLEEKHEIRRIIRDDLPSLLHTYLSLSIENQTRQKESVFEALCQMELTLHNHLDTLEGKKVQRIQQLLKLNKIRYDKK
ncbi:hypothetical protein [Pseudalkalibacillus caeni]|uniref:Uncharacterized protein n=1 Tax=Exobacillus caeni TaxID=2574798 RepID=A0A5R9F1L5_9BACL|nr:hypothetical protein [Pseudalkalibacillus caeni]TLS37532.1 hypothetical protein FCL54_10345 [Pseudalkalibacillus caeni]